MDLMIFLYGACDSESGHMTFYFESQHVVTQFTILQGALTSMNKIYCELESLLLAVSRAVSLIWVAAFHTKI